MVSSRPPTSMSSSLFSNPLVTVPNAPNKIGIIVTCMFNSFFNSLPRLRYLSFFSHSFSFILWSAGTTKSLLLSLLLLLLLYILNLSREREREGEREGERGAWNSLALCDSNKSPNPWQKTSLRIINKNCVQQWERKRKERQVLRACQKSEKYGTWLWWSY